MSGYKIEDLKIGTYKFDKVIKTGIIGRVRITEQRRGVLYGLEDGYFIDLITNSLVPSQNINGEIKSFIAKNELVSVSQIKDIFSVIDVFNENISSEPEVMYTNVFKEIGSKVKKMGARK